MSIFGKSVKVGISLLASGVHYVIIKGTRGLEHRYGKNEIVKTASEIGTSSVRVTESTVKTLADVVDGGIDAGIGYLSKDEERKKVGLQRAKDAGQGIAVSVKEGIITTAAAAAKATTSAVTTGKHYVNGDEILAKEELAKTKVYAKHLGKLIAVGLLALGAPDQSSSDQDATQNRVIENKSTDENDAIP